MKDLEIFFKNRKELGAYISSLGFSKVRQQYGTLFWVGLDITEEYHQKNKRARLCLKNK